MKSRPRRLFWSISGPIVGEGTLEGVLWRPGAQTQDAPNTAPTWTHHVWASMFRGCPTRLLRRGASGLRGFGVVRPKTSKGSHTMMKPSITEPRTSRGSPETWKPRPVYGDRHFLLKPRPISTRPNFEIDVICGSLNIKVWSPGIEVREIARKRWSPTPPCQPRGSAGPFFK